MPIDPTLTAEQLTKVSDHWAAHSDDFQKHRHWTEIPAVKARINLKITSDRDVDLFAYVIRNYFQA
jgi:hypothetical protein